MPVVPHFPRSWDAVFREALRFHQQGQLSLAAQRYRQILQAWPRHHQALHLLGVIAAQQGHPAEAVDLIARAISIFWGDANYHVNHGNALKALGQVTAALGSYRKAVEIQPSNPSAQSNLGVLLHSLGELREAVVCFDRALALQPQSVDVEFNRAVALHSLGEQSAALEGFDRVVGSEPSFVDAWSRRATILLEQGRWLEAVGALDRVIALQPTQSVAFYNRGFAMGALGSHEEAVTNYDRAIALNPTFAQAHCNLGVALQAQKKWEAALASLDQAVALSPDYVDAHINRGVVLHALQRWDAALAAYDQALHIDPTSVVAHTNRGVVLHASNRLDEASASYAKALSLQDDYAEAHFYGSLILLLRGDFLQGWNEYQWLWKTANGRARLRTFAQPSWTGQALEPGQRVLVHCEQGFGDTIQFCRYAQLLAERGAYVIFEVASVLMPLLRGLNGVAHWVCKGDPLPDFDYQCLLLSLPRIFDTDLQHVPSQQAYLRADASRVARWGRCLGPRVRPRVGLVWKGSSEHMNDACRSLDLEALLAVLPDGVDYVSLQKEVGLEEIRLLQSNPRLRHVGDELQDFAETAAVCACLDVVMSVDTSVAHLSAALGRPTWILLAAVPDWRWMLGRSDSPWYASALLWRQPVPGDWQSVLQSVSQSLEQFLRKQVIPRDA